MKGKHSLEETNAEVLVQLILDPDTPADLQVKMMNKLMEARREDSFFNAMLREMVSYGACPNCQHENHWLIPEDELNKVGYVTHERDQRVPRHTTERECPKWQQACAKKRVST